MSRTASGPDSGLTRYAFTGTDDSPDIQLTATGAIGERYIGLPGGVLFRKGYAAGTATSWAVSNLHGDVTATVTGATVSAGFVYDPYGQPLNAATGVVEPTATPSTRTGTTTDAWHGTAQRGYEHTGGLNQMLMGARTYLPALGIFTATDPIEGGNTTTYAYPQDPINASDLDGRFVVVRTVYVYRTHWYKSGGRLRYIKSWRMSLTVYFTKDETSNGSSVAGFAAMLAGFVPNAFVRAVGAVVGAAATTLGFATVLGFALAAKLEINGISWGYAKRIRHGFREVQEDAYGIPFCLQTYLYRP